jgi:hypothetical protein
VAWEGEEVSGTVRIEPSAWGTRVTMTVQTAQEEVQRGSVAEEDSVRVESAAEEEEVQPLAPPEAEPETAAPQPIPLVDSSMPTSPPTFLGRLRARLRRWGAGPILEPQAKAPEPWPVERAAVVSQPVVRAIEVVPQPVPSEPKPAPPANRGPATPPREAGEPPPSGPDSQAADLTEALKAALESLGQAHHRPYSRA